MSNNNNRSNNTRKIEPEEIVVEAEPTETIVVDEKPSRFTKVKKATIKTIKSKPVIYTASFLGGVIGGMLINRDKHYHFKIEDCRFGEDAVDDDLLEIEDDELLDDEVEDIETDDDED